jgi:hypothetical protein
MATYDTKKKEKPPKREKIPNVPDMMPPSLELRPR